MSYIMGQRHPIVEARQMTEHEFPIVNLLQNSAFYSGHFTNLSLRAK
jgi:hypothetical protein